MGSNFGGPLGEPNSFLPSSISPDPRPPSPGLSSLLNLDIHPALNNNNSNGNNVSNSDSTLPTTGPPGLKDLFQMLPNVPLNYPSTNNTGSHSTSDLPQHPSDPNLSNASSFLQPKDWGA